MPTGMSLYGATWTQQTAAGGARWRAVAYSSDGNRIAAGIESGGYISTSVDGGVTWTERNGTGLRSWWGLDMSADGSQMVAAPNGGYLYSR